MRISVNTDDATSVGKTMRRLLGDQIPYAAVLTVNELAKGAQKKQREHQRRIFDVRKPQFVDRSTKLKPFASKRSPVAVLSVDPPGGQARADILTKFEEDTEKVPRGRSLAIPSKAKRGRTGVVTKSDRLKNLNLRDRGRKVAVGDKRTFMIRNERGEGVVLRRVGKGRNSRVKILYFLTPRARIRPELHFVRNIERYVRDNYDEEFGRQFDRAIRKAR